MKKRKWIYMLYLGLAICLLAGLALSAHALYFVGDISGDGKVTAFDAQMLAEAKAGKRTLTDAQQAIADKSTINNVLSYIFGNTAIDGGNIDANSFIEIYAADGLQLLHDDPTANYSLMNDIDMAGADWTPVVGFSGTLNGNGHTISNMNITESTASCLNANSVNMNMGFIGDTTGSAVISDLHLRNVTITATEEALYMGLLAGSVRGQISDCTATGTIIDNRQTHGTTSGELTFIGVLVGRIPNPSTDDEVGSVIGGTSVSVFDEQGKYETTGLCADAKLLIANKEQVNLVSGVHQKIGVVGYAPSDATISGIWADSSNSSDLLSESVQQRQDTAVDYMNAMGTIAWKPTEDLVYTASDGGGKTYKAGTTYYGLPYNHKNGSLERFLSAMESQDENGVYTPSANLGSSIYYVNENGIGGYDGFIQLMGNDCSTSLSWAWRQISPTRVAPGANDNQNEYAGGVHANRTRYLVPNDTNRETYGVYPVGDWTSSDYDETAGKWTKVDYDASLAAYAISSERSTEDVLMACGLDVILEAYAQAHKADGLVRHNATPNVDENGDPVLNSSGEQTYTHYGHCRMLTADPVVIRNADGSIDAERSYVLTTEQGSPTGSTSTWKVNYKRSFATISTFDPEATELNLTGPYLPVTIRALRDEAVKTPYVTQPKSSVFSGPVTGKFYSNYSFISLTVTVTDAAGNICYDREAFTGVSFTDSGARSIASSVDLSTLHSEAFYAAAESSMTDGEAYYYTVMAKLGDGTVVNLNQKFLGEEVSVFTYTAPTETTDTGE